MPEEPPAHSGSRWEPSADEPTRPLPAAPAESAAPAASPASAAPWRDRFGKPVAAVAAAGVVAAVGVGGFAIGRATGEDHRPAPTSFTRDGGVGNGTGEGDRPWSGQNGVPGHDWGDHDQEGGRGGQFQQGQGDQGFSGGPETGSAAGT